MTDNQQEKNLRLLKVRQALGLKQVEMADLLGINRGNLSNIEKGKEGRNVPKDAKFILEREKNVNPVWFETGKGPMFFEKVVLPGGDGEGIRIMKDDLPDGFEEPHREDLHQMTPEQKLLFVMEKNQEIYDRALKANEEARASILKNVELLEEISRIKDKLLKVYEDKSREKSSAHDPVGSL